MSISLSDEPAVWLDEETNRFIRRDGSVITTTIAETALMKESSAIHSTKRARLKSLLARISNASETSIVATVSVFFAFHFPFGILNMI